MTPRLRTIQKSANSFLGQYKGHVVDVSRQSRNENWYLLVTAPNGCYSCDGWWRDSTEKTRREAVLEALRGALLWE